jgi:FixJ family two-component response regulator
VQWNLLTRTRINSRAEGILIVKNQDIIAIIDDDVLVREGVKRLVYSLSYVAITFSSAEEFLASDSLRNARCIISDVRIAGGGTTFLQDSLAAIGCNIPVVFMTALLSQTMKAKLLGAGAICVLSKPFHQDEMANCIAAAFQQTKTKAATKACVTPGEATEQPNTSI